MIPVVLVQVPKQIAKVQRLVNYCRCLDGTEIIVLPARPEVAATPPVIGHGEGGNGAQLCFEQAMQEFKGTPFFWIEVDAIPLKPGWRAAIEKEYSEAGKQFLLPSLAGLHPGDVASGIGIYPAGAVDIIPHNMHWPRLWDLWIYQERAADIHFTNLIQHSYALYTETGGMRNWHFPEDQSIIGPETLVFHRDPEQSLIPV
jgi:hypothetical protein